MGKHVLPSPAFHFQAIYLVIGRVVDLPDSVFRGPDRRRVALMAALWLYSVQEFYEVWRRAGAH